MAAERDVAISLSDRRAAALAGPARQDGPGSLGAASRRQLRGARGCPGVHRPLSHRPAW